VNDYFKKNQIHSTRGGIVMLLKSSFLLTLTALVYYLCICKGMFILSPFFGFLLASIGLSVQHDANHGSFSSNQLINRLASFTDEFIGGSALMWRHQHNIAHHALPNHKDIDADTFSNFPLMRFNPKLPIASWNKYQHIYGPVLYSLLGISYPIGDILAYLRGHYEYIPIQPLRPIDRILFILGKSLHTIFCIIIPIYLFGISSLFYFYFPMQLFGSFYLASLFAVSHNNSVCEYNINLGEKEWAEIQIRTSANWSVGSFMWLCLSGGLNYQIEHHLFPGVSHIYYPAISKIVKRICEEEKIPYNSYPTFTSLYVDHILTLKKLAVWKQ